MANAPAHKFGQLIGDLLEEIMLAELQAFCKKRGLYLDVKGARGKARPGKKISWEDRFGNLHDLDFVIEHGGSKDIKGKPLAFIEAAWRRYTKHSRNKAQEIQGAILPIAEKHAWDKPFLGAVLAGVFTANSVAQMRSSGFEVVLFPYESIVAAFNTQGIDIAFDESTPDPIFEHATDRIKNLSAGQWDSIKVHLTTSNQGVLAPFLAELAASLDRKVQQTIILPLHGCEKIFLCLNDAREFIRLYNEENQSAETFIKYEISVVYSNGDKINASFNRKAGAFDFLDYVSQRLFNVFENQEGL